MLSGHGQPVDVIAADTEINWESHRKRSSPNDIRRTKKNQKTVCSSILPLVDSRPELHHDPRSFSGTEPSYRSAWILANFSQNDCSSSVRHISKETHNLSSKLCRLPRKQPFYSSSVSFPTLAGGARPSGPGRRPTSAVVRALAVVVCVARGTPAELGWTSSQDLCQDPATDGQRNFWSNRVFGHERGWLEYANDEKASSFSQKLFCRRVLNFHGSGR